MEDTNPELESFRQRWREEVSARSKERQISGKLLSPRPEARTEYKTVTNKYPSFNLTGGVLENDEDIAEGLDVGAYHDSDGGEVGRRLGDEANTASKGKSTGEPQSALDHYEKAVEREEQGNLGDSLNLYRKAYRAHSAVDQSYKDKYFPPSSVVPKSANKNPSNAPVTVPNPAHHSLEGPTPSLSELLSAFSKLSIPIAEPPTDRSPPLPCPIASLPSELLIEILLYTAIGDVASFARISRACKRFAYLVSTEERIWRRICCGSEFGFEGMYYRWSCDIFPTTLVQSLNRDIVLGGSDDTEYSTASASTPLDQDPLTLSLLRSTYSSSWRRMFRTRPRIRFSGCYISTVNYVRPGASSATQISWNSPVHIVTYYRYLRFFRDGTAVSLLTTSEPADVVYHLTQENMHSHHTGALPSAVMKHALRGRWRLSGLGTGEVAEVAEREGDLYVETQGVDIKYMYRMHLSLRSAGRGAKNNKLSWKSFWCHNRLTDDWAEFGLGNDRPFIWSRVKSYGMGG
ncbi:MAG: hypothetical protein M1836_001216 [Candelina mexicana]|nr:MAG: hypothetical protein M1836_001216 [Candelina mexicana]